MAGANALSADFVREALSYDHLSGKLFWKHRPMHHFASMRSYKSFNTKYAGKEAFTSDDGAGYCQGRINNVSLRAHVVAFLIFTGEWPSGEIDHANGDRSDNRWENIRNVTRTENARNNAMRSDNTSGVTGVVWHNQMKKWWVRLGNKSLGLFDSLDDARAVRLCAQDDAGYTSRHGAKESKGA